MHREREEVYVVVRYDAFHGPDTRPEVAFTVKEVVRDRALAEAEVTRLNAINGEKGVLYYWQITRLFPAGQSAGSQDA